MSYAIVVRDAMLTRLAAMPYFAGFARRSKTRAFHIRPEHIPYLGCYFVNESMTPDGDADAGEPRFHCLARYGFSVVVQNNNPDIAEAQLDLAFDTITTLFNDPSLYNNPAALIQGYARGERAHVYGNAGLNNEMPYAELRFDLTIDLGTTDWPPDVPDDLNEIALRTLYPSPSAKDSVTQIFAPYFYYDALGGDIATGSPEFGRPDLAIQGMAGFEPADAADMTGDVATGVVLQGIEVVRDAAAVRGADTARLQATDHVDTTTGMTGNVASLAGLNVTDPVDIAVVRGADTARMQATDPLDNTGTGMAGDVFTGVQVGDENNLPILDQNQSPLTE